MKSNVIIYLSNTLMAVGVRHLLRDVFGITAQCVTPDDFERYAPEADYIVADFDNLPQRDAQRFADEQRLVLLSGDNVTLDGAININFADDESVIIEKLNKLFNFNEVNATHGELSQREIDVLRLIAAGRLNKEIANELNISINTVLTHRKNITAKLGIKSVSGLSFYAMMNGIITPSQALEK